MRLSENPPAYLWFLPAEDPNGPCPNGEPRWRAVYVRNGMEGDRGFPVEVCAPDEETAAMRAGMKRAELTKTFDRCFYDMARAGYNRVSLERV